MNKQYGEHNRAYNKKRLQYILAEHLVREVPNLETARVLDVGAGLGEFADQLAPRVKEIVCVEGEDTCFQVLQKKQYESFQIDLEEEPLPFAEETFDVVVSLEVIEHLWNIDHYLSEIKRVLRPGGYGIITTPNYNHWKRRITVLRGNLEKFTYKSRHKKFYTAKSLPKEVASYLEVRKAAGVGTLPKTGYTYLHTRYVNIGAVHIGVCCQK